MRTAVNVMYLSVSENGPCLGSRKPKQPYEWISYSEVQHLCIRICFCDWEWQWRSASEG